MSAHRDDDDQVAKDHGNLIDLEVVEVERESGEVAGDDDDRHDQRAGKTEAVQSERARDQQVSELAAEEHAEAQESAT